MIIHLTRTCCGVYLDKWSDWVESQARSSNLNLIKNTWVLIKMSLVSEI